jgi:predicted  nucleic acid-binding Zn-ribbon protein
MANKSADLFKNRLKEVDDEISGHQKRLEKLQEALRKNNTEENRRAVQQAKEPLIALADERADLARSLASALGGRNFFPPA